MGAYKGMFRMKGNLVHFDVVRWLGIGYVDDSAVPRSKLDFVLVDQTFSSKQFEVGGVWHVS